MGFSKARFLKFFVLFYVSMTSVNYMHAQRTYDSDVVVGITASQISGDGLSGFEQFGFHFGGLVNTSLGDQWDLHTGLIWNQKGSRSYKSDDNIIVYRLRANYLEVPVLFRVNLEIARFEIDYFFAEIGPTFNFLTNYRERTSAETISNRPFRPFELAGVASFGFHLLDDLSLVLQLQNSILPVRPHLVGMSLPPSNFVIGDWHNRLYELGQYFTSLSLQIRYRL